MERELDRLLARLRQTSTDSPMLRDFDQVLRNRLAGHVAAAAALSPRLRLSFQVAAVTAAFFLGVVMGIRVPGPPPPGQTFLVDVLDP